MTAESIATLQINQILDEVSPLLIRRSEDRRQMHNRRIDEIHQTLSNRGIDIAFQPIKAQFTDQCRVHIQEDIFETWATVKSALSEPYPKFNAASLEEIYSKIVEISSPLDNVLVYFHDFEVRLGRPELKDWVDQLRGSVAEERDAQLKLLRVEIVKLLTLAKQDEESKPTYLDQKLRWVKNKPLLAWTFLIISAVGIVGGLQVVLQPLTDVICGSTGIVECIHEALK